MGRTAIHDGVEALVERDLEGRWTARSITRQELEDWSAAYEVPTEDELATYDPPA